MFGIFDDYFAADNFHILSFGKTANSSNGCFNRQIKDLRISLTDRCNFRCFYCNPNHNADFAKKDSILSFEEIIYISEIFVGLGIEKIRLTGGEPLLRKNIETLIENLSKLKNRQLKDLALTTNGFSLARRAETLKLAGLDRVTRQRH